MSPEKKPSTYMRRGHDRKKGKRAEFRRDLSDVRGFGKNRGGSRGGERESVSLLTRDTWRSALGVEKSLRENAENEGKRRGKKDNCRRKPSLLFFGLRDTR